MLSEKDVKGCLGWVGGSQTSILTSYWESTGAFNPFCVILSNMKSE